MRSYSQFEEYTHTSARRCAQAVDERANDRGRIAERLWCLYIRGKAPAPAPSPLVPRPDSQSSSGRCLWTHLRPVLTGLLEVVPRVNLPGEFCIRLERVGVERNVEPVPRKEVKNGGGEDGGSLSKRRKREGVIKEFFFGRREVRPRGSDVLYVY